MTEAFVPLSVDSWKSIDRNINTSLLQRTGEKWSTIMASKKAAEENKDSKKNEKKEPEKPATLGTKEVADLLGTSAPSLRRFLRAKGKGVAGEGEYNRYEWTPGGKELEKLKKDWALYQEELKVKSENAKKAKDDTKKGSKKDAGKKGKKSESTKDEDEAEEVE